MSYDSNVPTTGHSASQDYAQMQANYAQIQTSFSVNHRPLASGAGSEGYHTVVQFPAVVADPNLVSPATSLYIKTVSAESELFFQNGALAADAVQLTGSIISASGNTGAGSTFSIFQTPWGIRIFAGQTQSLAAGSNNLTLSTGSFGATIYTAQATAIGAASATYTNFTPAAGSNTLNFYTSGVKSFYWMVICT